MIHKRWAASEGGDLPVWFRRPGSRFGSQASLFPESIGDVLARLKVSADELRRWHANDWISFDAESAPLLEDAHISELIFVCDVVRSGLPDAILRVLFDQLPKPVDASPDRIAFSFTHGWVMPAFVNDPDPDELMEMYADEWLEQLAMEARWDRLIELKETIDGLLPVMDASDRQESDE